MIAVSALALFYLQNKKLRREKKDLIVRTNRQRDRREKVMQLSEAMNWAQTSEKHLLRLIKTIKEITGAHRTYIYLYDLRREFLLGVGEDEDFNVYPEFKTIPKSLGRLSDVLVDLKPGIIEDLRHPHPDDDVPQEFIDSGSLSVIIVPLLTESEAMGCLSLLFDRYMDWNAEFVEYISDIGKILGVHIRNAKFSDSLRELAILQERKHLSQELHDNFSQLTSALSMRTEAARLSCEGGNLEITLHELERIIDTTHEVQRLLRTEMIGLRTGGDEQGDLMPLVSECIENFTRLTDIPVTVDKTGIPETITIPIQIRAQFLRILQEGLSNVRRHSKASQVILRIKESDDQLWLEIEDNGLGFDISSVSPDRLGLRIIQERAQDVGGSLNILSTKGHGACIQVRFPLTPFPGVNHEN